MDHDQRFKSLIREFFAEFLQLFFVSWAERFDLSQVEWLETEAFPNPPEGDRHQLDLVAQVRTHEPIRGSGDVVSDSMLALLHIEIESPDRTTSIKSRLPSYYVHLRNKYGLPVLPMVLYLKVGLNGVGTDTYEEHFCEHCPLTFRYLYVGLPGLDAVQFMEGENWLGVALSALMRIPTDKAAWLGAEALRRIADAPLKEQQRFLLSNCVEAYLSLDEQQKRDYERLMQEKRYLKGKAMNKTSYDRGIEQGLEQGLERGLEQGIGQGREEGMQRILWRMGVAKFGIPTLEEEAKFRSIENLDHLEALSDKILIANSWEELLLKERD